MDCSQVMGAFQFQVTEKPVSSWCFPYLQTEATAEEEEAMPIHWNWMDRLSSASDQKRGFLGLQNIEHLFTTYPLIHPEIVNV